MFAWDEPSNHFRLSYHGETGLGITQQVSRKGMDSKVIIPILIICIAVDIKRIVSDRRLCKRI